MFTRFEFCFDDGESETDSYNLMAVREVRLTRSTLEMVHAWIAHEPAHRFVVLVSNQAQDSVILTSVLSVDQMVRKIAAAVSERIRQVKPYSKIDWLDHNGKQVRVESSVRSMRAPYSPAQRRISSFMSTIRGWFRV